MIPAVFTEKPWLVLLSCVIAYLLGLTVRDRDTMEQVRLPISEVRAYIESRLVF